jgi:glycosyltransferase involved in cell wall biosynthesis
MKYSVIIPTYRSASLLIEGVPGILKTLESLEKQTFRDFEVIISDDGSPDGTLALLQQYKSSLEIILIEGPNWGGPARPRNQALAQARGEWVAFLDHDDLWTENKLEALLPYLGKAQVIYHDMMHVFFNPSRPSRIQRGRFLDSKNPFLDLLTRGNALANSGTAVKREVLLAEGGFSESRDLIGGEDFDLWLRLAQKGYIFQYIPEALGALSIHGANFTQASQRQIDLHEAIYRSHIKDLGAVERRFAKAFLSYIKARNFHRMGDRAQAWPCYKEALSVPDLLYKLKALYGLVATW